MKKIKLIAVIIAGVASFCVSANSMAFEQQFAMSPSLEKNLVKVCKALKSNSKTRLRRAIKHARVSHKAIAEKLVCNGMDPVSFALSSNADATADYLVKHSKTSANQIARK